MLPRELFDALTKTDLNDRTNLNAVANALGERSRNSIEEAVRLWASGDADMTRKAAYVLGYLGDVAIGPLLDAEVPENFSPLLQAWRIKRIVKEQVQRRNEIVAELERLLEDKTEIPYPFDPAPIEEPPPDERICDLAYIMLLILLSHSADSDEYDSDISAYRDLEFEERDSAISKYLSDGSFGDYDDDLE
jgi:hypothetical protein